MEQIPDPLESQEPMEKELQDDQLLDELERSIENPAGFKDPLASHDRQFMDDLAKQLDGLEASIEDTSQSDHGTPIVPDNEPTAPQDGGPVISDAVSEGEASESIQDSGEPEDTYEDSQATHEEGRSDGKRERVQFPRQQRFRGNPRLRGRRRHLFGRRGPSTLGRRVVRRQGSRRFCPESHEVINVRECESCEKYRHWPGGTDEEPRECWYHWQAKPPSNEPDGDEK
ncbi:MAG: hypothetical protein ACE5H0_11910 [Bacteroidota bacterium]